MERKLAQHFRYLGKMFYRLIRNHTRKVAFEFVDGNGVACRFNNQKKPLCKCWLKSICKRHKLSVRDLDQYSVTKAMDFNKVQVTRFCYNQKSGCMEKKFPAQ